MSDDTGRCLRGPDCETPDTLEQDGSRVTVGAPSDRPLCRACETATREALRAAPGLWVGLRNQAIDRLGGSNAPGTRVRRSRPGSFGLNAGPLHLADSLLWQVTAWADEVIHTAGRPTVDRASQPEGGQVQDACLLLDRYLSVWTVHGPVEFALTRRGSDPDDPKAQPTDGEVTVVQAGWEACAWLVGWRGSAERSLKTPPLIHYPPEPCPACNQPGVLKRRDGDDKVSCTACGKAWTLRMYETFVHAWMKGAPADELTAHHGPRSAADGQDARRGSAAHVWTGAA
jgi:hypothetical protein